MILVFGGTTEGRRAIKALEAAGRPYFYSTKTGEQEVSMVHGVRTDGAMDADEIGRFCRVNGIRLIVDAAHPFASRLHQNIADVARSLQIPVVRFERIYPPRDADITWIDDYAEVPADMTSLLATTGVQSIKELKHLEKEGVKVIYRILNRPTSIAMAKAQGATDGQLCYYEDGSEGCVEAEAILVKESGMSGGFMEKVADARAKGMRIIALRRPPMPISFHTVDGEYGLRRMVERLLPSFYPLHSGLTTGTCATAAVVAAILQGVRHKGGDGCSSSFTPQSSLPEEVPVQLPDGETISVPVHYGDGYAFCIKESGDDPDVTNGIEVRAALLSPRHEGGEATCPDILPLHIGLDGVEVYAGEGIGRFTLPGFDFPPGEAAVNHAPREMLRVNVANILAQLPFNKGPLSILLSVPDGGSIAQRTFNPRLGIEGGISIIGVSGIVMPYSEEAFVESIRRCMTVARASGADRIVIGSGMKSHEQLSRLYPDLPPQAFVEYGNYIGETLKMADELDIGHITLGIMIGKAVKLAQGHLDTHSRRVTMDKDFVAQLLREAHCQSSLVNNQLPKIAVARELWDILSSEEADRFSEVVVRHCYEHCKPLLPKGELCILLLKS